MFYIIHSYICNNSSVKKMRVGGYIYTVDYYNFPYFYEKDINKFDLFYFINNKVFDSLYYEL